MPVSMSVNVVKSSVTTLTKKLKGHIRYLKIKSKKLPINFIHTNIGKAKDRLIEYPKINS